MNNPYEGIAKSDGITENNIKVLQFIELLRENYPVRLIAIEKIFLNFGFIHSDFKIT